MKIFNWCPTDVILSKFLIEPANITLAVAGRGLDTEGIVADPELSEKLGKAISIFAQAILEEQ